MANQYGPVAAAVFDGAAYRFEYMLQCVMFGLGHAKRVIGVNTGKLQGFLVIVGNNIRMELKVEVVDVLICCRIASKFRGYCSEDREIKG